VKAQLGNDWYTALAFEILCSATNSSLVTTRYASEFIWGYNDPLLEFLVKYNQTSSSLFQLQINQTSQDNPPTNCCDVFDSGQSDIHNIQQYVQMGGQSNLTIWGSDFANEISGTDATQFDPALTDEDSPFVFIKEALRSGKLIFREYVSLYGIDMRRYLVDPSAMLNASNNPINAGFYSYGAPNGVLNITAINKAPIFLSKPHFLDADPYYLECVDGMDPNETRHDIMIDVEPNTGKTMNAAKRLQINVRVDASMIFYPNISLVYMPVAWIEETGHLTEAQASQFKNSVYLAQTVSKYSRLAGLPVASVITVASLLVLIIYNRRKQHEFDSRHLQFDYHTLDN